MPSAEYMREYRARRKAAGAKYRATGGARTKGQAMEMVPGTGLLGEGFPVCTWAEDRTQPLRTVDNPYPDDSKMVVSLRPSTRLQAKRFVPGIQRIVL